jgi:hypothetical protein
MGEYDMETIKEKFLIIIIVLFIITIGILTYLRLQNREMSAQIYQNSPTLKENASVCIFNINMAMQEQTKTI